MSPDLYQWMLGICEELAQAARLGNPGAYQIMIERLRSANREQVALFAKALQIGIGSGLFPNVTIPPDLAELLARATEPDAGVTIQ